MMLRRSSHHASSASRLVSGHPLGDGEVNALRHLAGPCPRCPRSRRGRSRLRPPSAPPGSWRSRPTDGGNRVTSGPDRRGSRCSRMRDRPAGEPSPPPARVSVMSGKRSPASSLSGPLSVAFREVLGPRILVPFNAVRRDRPRRSRHTDPFEPPSLPSRDEKRSFSSRDTASCGRRRPALRAAPSADRAGPVPAAVARAPASGRGDRAERARPRPRDGPRPAQTELTNGSLVVELGPGTGAVTRALVDGRRSRGASRPRGARPAPACMARRAVSKGERAPLRRPATGQRSSPPDRTDRVSTVVSSLPLNSLPRQRARRDRAGRVPGAGRRRLPRSVLVRGSVSPAMRSTRARTGRRVGVRRRQPPPRHGLALLARTRLSPAATP